MTRGVGALALLVAVACGCNCGDASEALAVLSMLSTTGVERDHGARAGGWVAAKVGDEFRLGDGLRTHAEGEAHLTLADGHELLVPENTLIRFVAHGEQGRRFEVEAGTAVFRAHGSALRLATPVGSAVLAPGSELRVRRTADGVTFVVEVGTARFTGGGADSQLRAGEGYEIGIGEAVLRPMRADAQAPPDASATELQAPPDAGKPEAIAEPSATVGAGEGVDGYLPGLSAFSLSLDPGRAATIHTPRPPALVGIEVPAKCTDEAVVRLDRRGPRYRGRGVVALPMAAGSHRYQLNCLTNGKRARRVAARGRVRVVRDAGTRRLPRRPPTSRIDADGRKYNVFYQNQPPRIVLRWPRPPTATAYRLVVDGEARTLSRAEHTFESGQLSDGTHEVAFEAAGRRSRTTKVRVRFDNAATTASLSAPGDGGFAPGETVLVSGVALPGWKVSAESGTIEMQSGDRFVGRVTTSDQRPDVVLRLSHPRLGTHYYLRHAARPP